MKVKTALLIFLFLLPQTTYAVTRYVGPSGSASWSSCTSTGTLCSISTALSNADDGDIVYIMGGNYYGTGTGNRTTPAFNPTNSGSSGAPITFSAYPGESVYMTLGSGSGPVIGGSSTRSYITWKGIHAQEGSTFLTDSGTVALWGGSHKIIEDCEIEGRTRYQTDNHDGVRIEDSSYNIVRNCWIHGYTGNGWNNTGIKIYGSSYNTVEYCTFTENALGVFDKRGNSIYNEYRYCLFYNNGLHWKAYSNTAYTFYGQSVHHCIFLPTNSSIPTTSLGTSSAIYFGGYGGESDFTCYNNTFYDVENTGGTGVLELLNFGDNVQIWNNIFMNISNRVLCVQSGDLGDITYSDYNQFYNISSSDAFRIFGQTSYGLTGWQSATSFEDHAVTSNPNFDGAGGTDDDDYQRSAYPTEGRGGSYESVIGAWLSDIYPSHIGQELSSADTTPPSVYSDSIGSSGEQLTITLTEECTGNDGFTITPSGGAATLSYNSGTGTLRIYDISRVILEGETVTLTYTEATGNILDGASNELTGFIDGAVVNNSNQTGIEPPYRLRFGSTTPKFYGKQWILD